MGSIQSGLLTGTTVVVTRAKSQSRELTEKIEALGGSVIEFPVIRFDPPDDYAPLDHALSSLSQFDWLIFTSVNGVEAFWSRAESLQVDLQPLQELKIAAIGSKTAKAIEKHQLQVDLISPQFYAESLVEALRLRVTQGDRVLIPRANIARDLIPDTLRELGCEVVAVDAYQTRIDGENREEVVKAFREERVDLITFTSSSTVRNFVTLITEVEPNYQQLLAPSKIVCIGPICAGTAESLGLKVNAVADPATIEGLMEAIKQLKKEEGLE